MFIAIDLTFPQTRPKVETMHDMFFCSPDIFKKFFILIIYYELFYVILIPKIAISKTIV